MVWTMTIWACDTESGYLKGKTLQADLNLCTSASIRGQSSLDSGGSDIVNRVKRSATYVFSDRSVSIVSTACLM